MNIDSKVQKIIEAITKAGFEVAVVGGAVRNIITGKEISDWDLAANAKPQDILKIIPSSFYNNRFGTVGFAQDKNNIIQITTYRTEEKYTDSRHPDLIKWGKTLEEDLERRDFTINAMALKISKTPPRWPDGLLGGGTDLKLIDPFNGQSDLKNKIIRAVGDPNKRFAEDALRMLRAIRFAATLNFKIEEKTFEAIKKNAHLLEKISGERIRDELFKIIDSQNPGEGIMLAKESGLLEIFLPELAICFSVEQKSPKRHHIYDVGTHCVMSLKHCPSHDTITGFAALLHDIGKEKVAKITNEGVRTFHNHEIIGARQVLQIAKRLQLAGSQREKLFKLVRWHQFTVNENQTDKALRRFIKNIGIENIDNMMDLRIGDRLGGGLQQPESWRLKLFRQRLKEVLKKPFTVKDLKVNGDDIMEILNIKPGPKVGEILNKLFDEIAEDANKNNREYLAKRIPEIK